MKPRSPRSLSSAAVALALAAALVGCGDDAEPADGTASDSAGDPSSSAPSSEPPASEPAPTDSDTDSGEPGTVAVPVYLVGDTPQGPALYREFVRVGDGDPLLEAATVLTGGDVMDPDYRTLLGNLGIESVTEGDLIDVALTADTTTNDKSVSPELGRLAVQSLVYTLQGTAQSRARVVVTQGGVPVTLYGVDTAGGVRAAPELDVLAHVNLTTPEEGATVSGSFTAEGRASSFEATVPWEIRDGAGNVVQEGSTMAEGWTDRLWPFTAEIDVSDLSPGTYTFAALTDDPSGGEGGGPHEDTRTIVVE